jgi:hypothetical protein
MRAIFRPMIIRGLTMRSWQRLLSALQANNSIITIILKLV